MLFWVLCFLLLPRCRVWLPVVTVSLSLSVRVDGDVFVHFCSVGVCVLCAACTGSIEQMTGSTVEAMALAVENAEVVLIGVLARAQRSPPAHLSPEVTDRALNEQQVACVVKDLEGIQIIKVHAVCHLMEPHALSVPGARP